MDRSFLRRVCRRAFAVVLPLAFVLETVSLPARAAEPAPPHGVNEEPLVIADDAFTRGGKPRLRSQDIHWQTFYEIAGSPALARSYLRRRRTILGMRSSALIIGVPGLAILMSGIAAEVDPMHPTQPGSGREPPYIPVGIAMSATALGLLLASTTIRRHPASPRRIHQMKDAYNQRMQARLPAARGPRPHVVPSVGFGSVGVVGRF